MFIDTRRAVARFLPRSTYQVATAFIREDGGRRNISAKILATLWYLLILPDSNSRFHRQLHRKRVPWYAPSRIIGLAVSAANIVAMPASWLLLFAGKKNAARLASLGVLANPPSITLTVLLVHELASQLVKMSSNLVASTGSLLAKPIMMIMPSEQNQDQSPPSATATSNDNPPPNNTTTTTSSTPTSTTTTTTTTPANDSTITKASTTNPITTTESESKPKA